MPLYEYECTSCKNRFEVRQKVTDEPISVCPTCGGTVRRVMHPVGIIFKGSGWYVTDNRAKPPTATPGDKPAGDKVASTETKSDGKSEAAGEKKSESKKESTPSSAPASSSSSTSDSGGSKTGTSSS
jgi:putative FmdB family regulatory protein